MKYPREVVVFNKSDHELFLKARKHYQKKTETKITKSGLIRKWVRIMAEKQIETAC